jgi:hypothetical protein
MLREHLHVELTFIARVEVKGVMHGPSRPRPAPVDPNTSTDPNEPD